MIGAPYTYCFEDGWPWIGDYDMNDVVVVTGIDRLVNKESGKVGSIRINWELKAASAAHLNAFAVQLDKVAASQVASVETTNTAFGKGAFAGPGLESGNEYAVIPLFNTAQEILGEGTYINTSKGTAPVPTVKHTTTVTFTQPVDAAAVLESAVNAFIVVNSKSSGVFSRDTEVHMPTYKPTGFAVVSGNTFAEAEQILRVEGNGYEGQLHDVGADDFGRVPLPCRAQGHPHRLYLFQRMGRIGRCPARGLVRGRSRRGYALLKFVSVIPNRKAAGFSCGLVLCGETFLFLY